MKTYSISEERILQISNDISEGMGNYTKAELVTVVTYWNDCYCESARNLRDLRLRVTSQLLANTSAMLDAITDKAEVNAREVA